MQDVEMSPINDILYALTKARLPNSIDVQLFMRMEYETAYGIYDHNGDDRPDVPWPLLACSPREDLSRVDPLDFRLEQYVENRVFDLFGIPFHELIKFPRRDYLKVIQSAKKHSAKLNGVGSGLKQLEKMLGQQVSRQG